MSTSSPLNQPFDLAKLDVNGIRLRRRKRLIVWSLPACIILVSVGVVLVTLCISNLSGQSAYHDKQYSSSADTFGHFLFINPIESYKMPFNQGTALVAARQYKEAQDALQHSLEAQPPKEAECQVRVNLVHAIAGHALQLIADRKYDDAIVLYDTAKSVIDSRDCGMKSSNGSSPSDETKDADSQLQKQRTDLTEKQNEAKRQRNGDSSDKNGDSSQKNDGSNDDAKDSSTPSQDQLDQLEKQQQQNAAKEQQRRNSARGYEGSGSSSYSPRDYKQKTW